MDLINTRTDADTQDFSFFLLITRMFDSKISLKTLQMSLNTTLCRIVVVEQFVYFSGLIQ